MSLSLFTLKEGMSYMKELPSSGLSQSQVMDKIKEYQTLSESRFLPSLKKQADVLDELNVSFQMRCSGREAVFLGPCTGAMNP